MNFAGWAFPPKFTTSSFHTIIYIDEFRFHKWRNCKVHIISSSTNLQFSSAASGGQPTWFRGLSVGVASISCSPHRLSSSDAGTQSGDWFLSTCETSWATAPAPRSSIALIASPVLTHPPPKRTVQSRCNLSRPRREAQSCRWWWQAHSGSRSRRIDDRMMVYLQLDVGSIVSSAYRLLPAPTKIM